jgi:RNA polymerase sigma factor (TIGR02999 family)
MAEERKPPAGDPPNQKNVTALLQRWRAGAPEALDELVPLVYDELRRVARAHMRDERSDHTLEPTALVHQAYERMLGLQIDWRDRAHFLNMASRLMRRILVDHARARQRDKRGGVQARVTLGDHRVAGVAPVSSDILTLEDGLEALFEYDERKAAMIQAHYFGGLSYPELAEVFAVSEATVHRELAFSRAWLARRLAD